MFLEESREQGPPELGRGKGMGEKAGRRMRVTGEKNSERN